MKNLKVLYVAAVVAIVAEKYQIDLDKLHMLAKKKGVLIYFTSNVKRINWKTRSPGHIRKSDNLRETCPS